MKLMNKPAPPAVPSLAEPSVDSSADPEEELQARVAWHYYVGNLTQQEIAQHIGSNRVRVNRLLAASRESGMVQITINSRIAPCVALEEALTKRFGLEAAVVVPTGATPTPTWPRLASARRTICRGRSRPGRPSG
jgi:lsr operon transcriptional repressor